MTSLWIDRDDDAHAECDNCDWSGPAGATHQRISDIQDRIEAGSTVPCGECPYCHALCYQVEESTGIIARIPVYTLGMDKPDIGLIGSINDVFFRPHVTWACTVCDTFNEETIKRGGEFQCKDCGAGCPYPPEIAGLVASVVN